MLLSAVARGKLGVGQLSALEQTGAYGKTMILRRDPPNFIEAWGFLRQAISIPSEYFYCNRIPLFDRPASREAASKIAHIFNESSIRDRLPLLVDFSNLNRNMH